MLLFVEKLFFYKILLKKVKRLIKLVLYDTSVTFQVLINNLLVTIEYRQILTNPLKFPLNPSLSKQLCLIFGFKLKL